MEYTPLYENDTKGTKNRPMETANSGFHGTDLPAKTVGFEVFKPAIANLRGRVLTADAKSIKSYFISPLFLGPII